ncbi:hypothetical protein GWI33_018532 [Rhynchophorus ferrugineus]|uniref:Uncharacterized protein n=1 Tax=Rhynchophorus ferrugineus TaxID=354439 RepID=A0A834HT68_RHYFE|nr:hypothetical protein GWI33_018532 [Rhynchophorus ferrugineus]
MGGGNPVHSCQEEKTRCYKPRLQEPPTAPQPTKPGTKAGKKPVKKIQPSPSQQPSASKNPAPNSPLQHNPHHGNQGVGFSSKDFLPQLGCFRNYPSAIACTASGPS